MAQQKALRSAVVIMVLWIGSRGTYLAITSDTVQVIHNSNTSNSLVLAESASNLLPVRPLGTAPNPLALVERFDYGKQPLTVMPLAEDQRDADTRALTLPPTSGEANSTNSLKDLFDAPKDIVDHPPILLPPSQFRRPSVAVSAWMLMRGSEGAGGLASNGQLGGSQTGARLLVPLMASGKSAQIALSGRISSPLRGIAGKEAALGIAMKPSKNLPLELIGERRIGLDRSGRDAFAFTAVAGISDKPLGAGWVLSAYGQTGIVGLKSRDAFADGALRIERETGTSKLRIGVGIWAAAQPGVSRIDIGPRVAHPLRIGGANTTVGAEWRQRIAGNAAPGSGAVIVIGGDF
jgi:hypothetical protein